MTALEFSAIFGLGVVSSLHCAQMCGPIVLAYSLPLHRGGWRGVLAAHAAYNLGRILTYSALGALAGLAGGALGLAARLAGAANGARVFAGAAMIVAALAIRGALPAPGLVQIEGGGLRARLSRTAGRLLAARNKFALGLLLGLLPCGLVYAALLKAVDAGTAGGGALTMLAFGLGTSATLAAIGVVSSAAGLRLGRWSNALAAASVALMGALLIWRGLAGGQMHVHHG